MAKLQTRDRNKNKPGKAPNWEYRFEGPRVAGKRTSVSKCGFKTKKEAEAAGAKALSEYYSVGKVFTPSSVSFHDLADKWLELYASVNLRDGTISSYKRLINNNLLPAFGSKPAAGISPEAIQSYVNQLKKDDISHSHAMSIFSLLKAILDYAVEPLHYIQVNPCDHVRLPKFEDKKKRNVISPENWERIIAEFPEGSRFFVPLMIGYYTGMRVGEVTGLTWDCFDPDARTLQVKQQLAYVDGAGFHLGPTKSASGNRTILISSDLVDILLREKARQEANRARYGEFYTSYELLPFKNGKGETCFHIGSCVNGFNFICSDENGEVTTSGTIRYLSRLVHHKLGIENFDFHSLRHTHATVLVAGGANYKAIQQRMGHHRIETTLQTYAHSTLEMDEDAVAIFDMFSKK